MQWIQDLCSLSPYCILPIPLNKSICVCVSTIQAYHGHCGALEVLLSSLLDVDVRSTEGRSPLSLACSRGHQECVALLLHHGASPMTCDYIHKKTAIHAAGTHTGCYILRDTNEQIRFDVNFLLP